MSYSSKEVRALVENYATFSARKDTTRSGLDSLLRLADVDLALAYLPLREYEVVLLHGMMGYTQEQVGLCLGISKQAINKRYKRGLDDLHYSLNNKPYQLYKNIQNIQTEEIH